MSEGVRAAWIAAVASVLAAVLGAILGRPVINEVTGTTDKIERLTEENKALSREVSRLKAEIEGLASRSPDREGQGETPRSEAVDPIPSPTPYGPGTEIASGIKFDLLGCNKNGSTVLCDVQLTGLERDIQNVYLTTDSILNVSGNETTATRASLGSKQNQRIHAWGDLVARVPKKGSLRFEGVGVDEDTATLLELKIVVGNDRFSVRFRDVRLG